MGVGISQSFTNVIGAAELSATITALQQSGEAQTLSEPRLTVLNNRPATISDGKVQYYYEEYQVKQTVQQYYTASSFVPSGKPTKITAGAELNVLASISGDGKSIVLVFASAFGISEWKFDPNETGYTGSVEAMKATATLTPSVPLR